MKAKLWTVWLGGAAVSTAFPIKDFPWNGELDMDQVVEDVPVRIDGGPEEGWEEDSWSVQVDGVMGGKSSGRMEFLPDTQSLKFTGDINLDGGGFSSVRRGINLDLSDYAGVVVTLEADARSAGGGTAPPTGLHLQFDDRSSWYDFSAAFCVPLSDAIADEPVVTSVYLPVESFDRGDRFGFECQNNCVFDASKINGMSVYVLFQEGTFDVRLRSIEAVKLPRAFEPPELTVLETQEDVVELLRSTISSGGGLYDKSYVKLCVAMYWSVLNTLLLSDATVVSDPVKAVICAGLEHVQDQMMEGDSKFNIAWTLRYAMDAVIADLEGSPRPTTQDWLPTPAEAASMEGSCTARTSPDPGVLYDPTNEYILVSENTNNNDNTGSNSNAQTTTTNNEEIEPETPSINDNESEQGAAQDSASDMNTEEEDPSSASLVESSEFLSGGTILLVPTVVVGTLLFGAMALVA